MNITIVGDRQTGKTDLLLCIAAREIAQGKAVIYQGAGRASVRDAMERFVRNEHVPANDITHVYRTNGKEMVKHRSGGVVYFNVSDGRGIQADIYLIDGVECNPEIVNPDARVYRTAL